MDSSSPTPATRPEMTIRIRRQDDIGRCVELLATVHAADGYPLLWPADPAAWLTPANVLHAWVAEDERAVMGHVVLCSAVRDAAAPLWCTAERPPTRTSRSCCQVVRRTERQRARRRRCSTCPRLRRGASSEPAPGPRGPRAQPERDRPLRAGGMASCRERLGRLGAHE
jgi:hypothetical protein